MREGERERLERAGGLFALVDTGPGPLVLRTSISIPLWLDCGEGYLTLVIARRGLGAGYGEMPAQYETPCISR